MMFIGMKDTSYLSDKKLEDAQLFNREFLRKRAIDLRNAEIANLQKKIENLQIQNEDENCKFCKDLTYQNRLYFDCIRTFGLNLSNDVVSCPRCKKCLAHWE